MQDHSQSSKSLNPSNGRACHWIDWLGGISSCLYLILTILSSSFGPESAGMKRPIEWFLLIVACLFGLYLISAWKVLKLTPTKRLISAIWIHAILFRLITIPAVPILEIDIYRYLWDGASCRVGVTPFRYSPATCRAVVAHPTNEPELNRLVELRDSEPAMAEILEQIHYADLTTIYPPVSQFVFAIASLSTPSSLPVWCHVSVLKAWLTLFDFGTLFVLYQLLKVMRFHPGYLILYGWCPLVIKEIAGSGHLDSIAIFFSVTAVYALVRFAQLASIQLDEGEQSIRIDLRRQVWLAATVIAFALAVGAKIYPIVLAPVFFGTIISVSGIRTGAISSLVALGLSCFLLMPLISEQLLSARESSQPEQSQAVGANESQSLSLPPQPDSMVDSTTPIERSSIEPIDEHAEEAIFNLSPNDEKLASTDPSGLKTFFAQWEMNDLAFMFVLENVRLDHGPDDVQKPWFVVLPYSARLAIDQAITSRLPAEPHLRAFQLTRFLSAAVVLGFGVWVIFKLIRTNSDTQIETQIIQSSFMLLVVFWVVSPTQNPWYWIWGLPFLYSMQNRGWWFVSGAVFLYYTRFWLNFEYQDAVVPSFGLPPDLFFYFVVVPIEHGSWLAVVGAIGIWRSFVARGERRRRKVSSNQQGS